MFPNGDSGWHGNILRVGCQTRQRNRTTMAASLHSNIASFTSFDEIMEIKEEVGTRLRWQDINDSTGGSRRKRNTVNCREYYVYKLQEREGDKSHLLHFGRLFQQYVIDNYIKLESMRLDYLRNHQKKLRREHYQGVIDSVISGVQKGCKVGKRIYLPATFIGGPRDMRHRYLDSMTLVQEYGRPDIFLTMTCNPNWPEIQEHLMPGEEAQNRPDLVARVFKAKLGLLHDKIMSGKAFGKVASVVYVVEFQKRGLPHAHFLIILKATYKFLTPEAYDRYVCAELPDQRLDPYLYSLVVKHMMYGPCGELNDKKVCMRNGKCKNHYPKDFAEHTIIGKGSYAIYRRRHDQRTAKVRGHMLDNRWVAPYNPDLLAMFNCHINVEVCCDIRVVKYLYKYIHEGDDKVMFRVVSNNQPIDVDEISDFQNERWVSPVEAAWRIFAFPLSGMYPAVIQLQVHLPNFQSVQFEDET